MLKVTEYACEFQEYAWSLEEYQGQQINLSELKTRARQFLAFLDHLNGRLNWELPLIEAFSEARFAIENAVAALKTLQLWVQKSPGDPLALEHIEACLSHLERLQFFFDQLPTFTDVDIVNDLLLLGCQNPPPSPSLLVQRLPALVEWIQDLDAHWEMFSQLHPQRKSLFEKFQKVHQDIQAVAGGLLLYCEGQTGESLESQLSRLKSLLERLAPLEETRFWEESEKNSFSPDPVLEKAAMWLRHRPQLPSKYSSLLRRWLRRNSLQLAESSNWCKLLYGSQPGHFRQLALGLNQLENEFPKLEQDHSRMIQKMEQWRQQYQQFQEAGSP